MSVYLALKVPAGTKTGADTAPFCANVKFCVKGSNKNSRVSIKQVSIYERETTYERTLLS